MERETKEIINAFIGSHPKIDVAYGYGSGVFTQKNYDSKNNPQIDLIIGVDDIKSWNLKNIELNPNDYTKTMAKNIKYSPDAFLKFGAPIIYVPFIPYNNHTFKIGVANTKDINYDLENWNKYFFAGRFQKPTYEIVSSRKTRENVQMNQANAIILSTLLMEKDSYTKKELYKKLFSLSYIGEIRNLGFEDLHKIENSVSAQYNLIDEMYEDKLIETQVGDMLFRNNGNTFLLASILPFHYNEIDSLIIESAIKYPSKLNVLKLQKMLIGKLAARNALTSTKMCIKEFGLDAPSSIKYVLEKRKKYNSSKK